MRVQILPGRVMRQADLHAVAHGSPLRAVLPVPPANYPQAVVVVHGLIGRDCVRHRGDVSSVPLELKLGVRCGLVPDCCADPEPHLTSCECNL